MERSNSSLVARLVGATLVLLASVTLAAIVLHGWRMHRSAQTGHQRSLRNLARLGAMQLTQAAELAAPKGLFSDEMLQQFDRWGWAVTRFDSGGPALATVLCDDRGSVRRTWPQNVDLTGVLNGILSDRESASWGEIDWAGRKLRVCAAACPLGVNAGARLPASLLVLAPRRDRSAAWGMWLLSFALPLGGVAAIGFTVGLRWLQSRVARPLNTLLRLEHEDEFHWLARLPTNRHDEFGGIARGTEEIIAQLCEARARLNELQRSLDLRVADRTREIETLLRDARREACLDPLTQLGNRRLLDDRLEAVCRAQLDSGGELTLVMFDIDNFKQHNDALGHAAGDELLRFFGQLLRSSLRDTDVGIRYAGDEFVVLAADASPGDAVAMATRIVRLFAQHTSVLKTDPKPTVSAGVASLRLCSASTGAELLACADAAMYQAKGQGKNDICVWTAATALHAEPIGSSSTVSARTAPAATIRGTR